jgi:uncharacterized protein YggE
MQWRNRQENRAISLQSIYGHNQLRNSAMLIHERKSGNMFYSPKSIGHALLLSGFLLAGLSIATGPGAMAGEAVAVIAVSGNGKISLAPDMAVIALGVQREAKTAREALSQNNEAMGFVLAELKAVGIAEKDLQTSGFNIQPRYHYPKQGPTGDQRPPRIIGYLVSNQLSVRVRDLSKLGEILDKSVSLGMNSGGGIRFLNENTDDALMQARKKAVANAFAKARILSESAGVKLGKILEMREDARGISPRPMREMAMARSMAADAVPVAAGENSYSVSVQVRWEIVQ